MHRSGLSVTSQIEQSGCILSVVSVGWYNRMCTTSSPPHAILPCLLSFSSDPVKPELKIEDKKLSQGTWASVRDYDPILFNWRESAIIAHKGANSSEFFGGRSRKEGASWRHAHLVTSWTSCSGGSKKSRSRCAAIFDTGERSRKRLGLTCRAKSTGSRCFISSLL
ncbi:hypothetical protein DAEQUDRAFT_37155 [Daedalea quercina L-15889]|uniref:Uncharacterized protein n=1 Tax=Daedalea quercina L-15889 TaxID=1314783 RepID=A0A165LFB7_9APHY|nr:hypothetical protein DAEQUDRAFT_37155 [Daedalea quercina L-15889]